ncbi:MAG: hypothetical protein AAF549_00120 [Pseudomonadota bacterium]
MKNIFIILGILVIEGATTYAMDQVVKPEGQEYSWRYKMTVTIDTPEGEISGSAVRQMGDNYKVSFPSEASNYGEVAGEAVVVDLKERGLLFALISSSSDIGFYSTFPFPDGAPETPEGYAYYQSLPIGTKAVMPLSSRTPRLVTFKDMDDPMSVELVYARGSCQRDKSTSDECKADPKGSYTQTDRFEELFGQGVKLKEITMEITDQEIEWGRVDQYLPKTFNSKIKDNWRNLEYETKSKLYPLTRFEQGRYYEQ